MNDKQDNRIYIEGEVMKKHGPLTYHSRYFQVQGKRLRCFSRKGAPRPLWSHPIGGSHVSLDAVPRFLIIPHGHYSKLGAKDTELMVQLELEGWEPQNGEYGGQGKGIAEREEETMQNSNNNNNSINKNNENDENNNSKKNSPAPHTATVFSSVSNSSMVIEGEAETSHHPQSIFSTHSPLAPIGVVTVQTPFRKIQFYPRNKATAKLWKEICAYVSEKYHVVYHDNAEERQRWRMEAFNEFGGVNPFGYSREARHGGMCIGGATAAVSFGLML